MCPARSEIPTGGPINAAQRTVINDVETEDIDERQDTDSQPRWQRELQEERLPIQLRPLRIELDDGVAKKQNTYSDEQDVQDFLQLLELRLLVAKCVDDYEDCQNELEDQLCEQAEDEKVAEEFYEDASRKRTLCGFAKNSGSSAVLLTLK